MSRPKGCPSAWLRRLATPEPWNRPASPALSITDRNPWYREVARSELSRLRGPLYAKVATAVGKDYVDKNIRTWEAMQKVLDSGEHRPTHLRGWKPDKER